MSRLLVSVMMLSACQAQNIEYYTDRWPVETKVRVWIEDHPMVPNHTILNGCNAWWPEGVVCTQTHSRDIADIRYLFLEDDCNSLKVEYGGELYDEVLGVANHISQEVRFHLDCFDGYPRRLNLEDVQAVAAHETGHHFGVSHVWEDCDTVAEQDFEIFTPHCGRAMMNTGVADMLRQETMADHEAFCFGDDYYSVVPFPDRRDRWQPENY